MAQVIYIICGLTSALCSILLLRAYFQRGMRFLLWSALCFAGFTVNNIILFLDLIIFPEIDLSVWRVIPALIGLTILVYGLIMDGS